MDCSNCGVCCTETEMLLSLEDIKRLEKKGLNKEDFACFNKQGYVQLKNKGGYCVFYNKDKRNCKVYNNRPSGCKIYPVIIDEEKGIVLDTICESRKTISKQEKTLKGKKVLRLLKTIDLEAEERYNNNATKKRKNPTPLNKPQNDI